MLWCFGSREAYDYIVLVMSLTIVLGCIAHLRLLRGFHGTVHHALTLLFWSLLLGYAGYPVLDMAKDIVDMTHADVRVVAYVSINIGVWGSYLRLVYPKASGPEPGSHL